MPFNLIELHPTHGRFLMVNPVNITHLEVITITDKDKSGEMVDFTVVSVNAGGQFPAQHVVTETPANIQQLIRESVIW